MKKIYKKILEKALPYYERGREGDVEHIKWLFETVPRFVDESEVDFDILIPVVILHDVGYSKVPKESDPLKLNIRKLHSKEGVKIAESILQKLDYTNNKISEIERLILKHDNWALGASFEDEPYLRLFNNFDFMWVVSPKGFPFYQKIVGGSPEETIKRIEEDQRKNIEEGRVWYNKKIEDYYLKLLNDRKKELPK